MNIKEILIDKIKKNGSLNVAEFIQISQCEKGGYYLKNNPIGRDNDFITSPEISQMFGEVLTIFIINFFFIFIYVLKSIFQLKKMECIIVDPLKSNKILNLNDNLALLSIQ